MKLWIQVLVLIIQATVSGAVLATALYVVLSADYGPDTDKWAFGAIGVILGFWLRVDIRVEE